LAYRVLYRSRAEQDLNRLARGATLEWFDGLCEAIESLAHFPERSAFVPEPGLRLKGVGSFSTAGATASTASYTESRTKTWKSSQSAMPAGNPFRDDFGTLLADGRSPTEIAEMLNLSKNTLKSQLASIYGKTGTSRQSQLVRLLLQISVDPAE
jgi:hypothetical protein